MKSNQGKQKFIELRAQGLSFSKISGQLNVSKPALIKWSEQFKEEIQNYHEIWSCLFHFS